MKFLVDSCIGRAVVKSLKDAGFDTVWSHEMQTDPGDEKILSIARAEKRVVITQDKDFGELAVFFEQPHSGILRLVGFSTVEQVDIVSKVITTHKEDLNLGALITVDRRKIRIKHFKDPLSGV
jgi:predicted nuclease of predicted toxin-antitoxin system